MTTLFGITCMRRNGAIAWTSLFNHERKSSSDKKENICSKCIKIR